MIPRYKVQEIHDIWKTENKLKTWLDVEIAHLESLSNSITDKTISKESFKVIKENAKIDIDRWKEIEKETRHDLQAFVQMLEESVPENEGRWIHFGLTSSDILDTSLSIMAKKSLNVIIDHTASVLYTLNKLLKSDNYTKNILARTHGKAAEVQTFYDVFYRWIYALRKGHDALVEAKSKISVGKLSGAVGNYKFNIKQCEHSALSSLGLRQVVASQIIPRQYYLDYFYGIMQTMLAVEKIAYDIRIYSLDGINEMAEPFRKGQKGSSAMPHKKNPILTENICGLTRLFKSYFYTAVENCTTLLERDISHSASERIIFKDSAHIACFTLDRLNNVLKELQINVINAKKNCEDVKDNICSQEKMNNLIKQGYRRKTAYEITQTNI